MDNMDLGKVTRREFTETVAGTAVTTAAPAAKQLSAVERARRHAIVRDLPTPDFFEGMLAGNGDIGVCVVLRPDALGLHFGKLDAWDIRVSEDHIQHVVPFAKYMEMWKAASERAKAAGRPDATFLEISDPELRAYHDKVRSSYDKPWPRPWPCGTVWIHWDSRDFRLKKQELDISSGVYTAEFELGHRLKVFVSREEGHVSISSDGPVPVISAAYRPHFDEKAGLPAPEVSAQGAGFRAYQHFPALGAGADRSFAMDGRFTGKWEPAKRTSRGPEAFLKAGGPQALRLDVCLITNRDDPKPRERAAADVERLSTKTVAALEEASRKAWREFWEVSAVEFADQELDRIWYHNQYFLACTLKPGKVAPGLFGNWSSGNIGTAWHGDYHMNYNTQQVWWGVFSSNHVEQHLPYVDLVEMLMPMARWNARVQFNLPGAYFPHSAYPVPSQANPYPVPPWGYEICETPWTVQSLWWQYLYTLDREYLKRVYPWMREATDFIVAYLKKESDGKYHVVPTVSPENWGSTVDFRLNRDCIVDLALIEFLLDSMIEGSRALGIDADIRERWAEVRRNLAPYPVGKGPRGEVWLDVANAPVEYVYNVPATLAPVWPAEQVGLDRGQDKLEIARRTLRTVRLEGGNDLVWLPLTKARLGELDFDWFKKEVRYTLTPNGVANDRVRQTGGRYTDWTNFDFMMRMGVWTENLALPAVLNECLIQSYAGVIRLFPNSKGLGPVRFRSLRAVGAFLVSAAWDGKQVTEAEIESEKGARARVVSPWGAGSVKVTEAGKAIKTEQRGDVVEFATSPGKTYRLVRG